MARRAQPLVQQLERRPGQQDHRWVHSSARSRRRAAPAPAAVDREVASPTARGARRPGAGDVRRRGGQLRRELSDELDDCRSSAGCSTGSRWPPTDLPVMEAGCGPGHVTAYLAAAGADATGRRPQPGDGRRGAAAGSRHPLRGGRPAAADAAGGRRRLGRGARRGTPSSTSRRPSCPAPSPPWPGRSHPAGCWCWACTRVTTYAG